MNILNMNKAPSLEEALQQKEDIENKLTSVNKKLDKSLKTLSCYEQENHNLKLESQKKQEEIEYYSHIIREYTSKNQMYMSQADRAEVALLSKTRKIEESIDILKNLDDKAPECSSSDEDPDISEADIAEKLILVEQLNKTINDLLEFNLE